MFEIIVIGEEQLRIATIGVELSVWVEYSNDFDTDDPDLDRFDPGQLREAITFFNSITAAYVHMTLREMDSTLVSLAQKQPDFEYVHPDLADHW